MGSSGLTYRSRFRVSALILEGVRIKHRIRHKRLSAKFLYHTPHTVEGKMNFSRLGGFRV